MTRPDTTTVGDCRLDLDTRLSRRGLFPGISPGGQLATVNAAIIFSLHCEASNRNSVYAAHACAGEFVCLNGRQFRQWHGRQPDASSVLRISGMGTNNLAHRGRQSLERRPPLQRSQATTGARTISTSSTNTSTPRVPLHIHR